MNNHKRPITPTEARRSLQALDILSGKTENFGIAPKKQERRETAIQKNLFELANSDRRIFKSSQ